MRHPKGGGKEYLTAPLLVMNNFTSPPPLDGSTSAVPRHLESLATTIFQSLFPPISPQTTPLSSIRRVLLLNRELPKSAASSLPPIEDGSYTINLRHYAITTKRTGLSRSIRRLNAADVLTDSKAKRGLPNLGKLDDVADYLLDPSGAGTGFTSGSESEVETDAEVEVMETNARKVMSRKQLEASRNGDVKMPPRERPRVERRAVKLVELGPRIKMRMTKVEEGVCDGKVMWHEFLSKSNEEVRAMEEIWEGRRTEKELRRNVQKENVERKRSEKRVQGRPEDEEEIDGVEDDWDDEGLQGDEDQLDGVGGTEVFMG